jgi:hypothetical protein
MDQILARFSEFDLFLIFFVNIIFDLCVVHNI